MLAELRALLRASPNVTTRSELEAATVETNVLGRSTVSARRKALKELRARYLLDPASPLFQAFYQEWTKAGSETEQALLAYLLWAATDRLLFRLGTEWLLPRLLRAPTPLTTGEVVAFLGTLGRTSSVARGWSEATRIGLARHYLAAIRDFGLARGSRSKVSVRPAAHPGPIRFLLRALLLQGVREADLAESPAFGLLGLQGSATIHTLRRLHIEGSLRFRLHGTYVELGLGATA